MQHCYVHLFFGMCLRAQVLLQNRDVCAAEDTYFHYIFICGNCYLSAGGFGHVEVVINAGKQGKDE